MILSKTTRHVQYNVDQKDISRQANCSKELIGENTFKYGFKPQLPQHCINLLQRQCPTHMFQQEADQLQIVSQVPIKPFHLNSFVSAAVDETDKDVYQSLPNNLEYLAFKVKHVDIDDQINNTKKKNNKKNDIQNQTQQEVVPDEMILEDLALQK